MTMTSIFNFYILATATVISTILVPFVARFSVTIGGIDEPGHRKVHTAAVPRLGGIAILCAFLFTVIYFVNINVSIKGILAGAMVIFLTGLTDDLIGLTPKQKLLGEFCAAGLAVVAGGIVVHDLGNPLGFGTIELGWFAIPFTIFGIVGMINAINLLDGLDGLAGGVCTIVCVDFAILAYAYENATLFGLSIALLGALIGFLRYNSHPAVIFMGDSGSLLLGYCMGVFSVLLAGSGNTPASPYIPLMLLGVPVMDTLVVMYNRHRAGKSTFLPDKTHIHHRMMDMGLGQKATVLIVYGITYLFSVIAIIGQQMDDTFLLFLLLAISTAVYALLCHLTKNPQRRRWLSRQGNISMRRIASLRSRVRQGNLLLMSVKYLILAILAMPLLLPLVSSAYLALLPLALLLASAVFYLMKSTWRNSTLQAYIYISGVLLVFASENLGTGEIIPGLQLKVLSHILFLLLLVCATATIALRNRTTKLLGSPLEYLIMLVVLTTPLLPYELTSRYHLLTVAAKSVILFVGFKLVLMHRMQRNRKILLAIMLASVALLAKFTI